MLDELFWILLRPLIFFQTQWLSFFAGILWGYFLRKSGGTSQYCKSLELLPFYACN